MTIRTENFLSLCWPLPTVIAYRVFNHWAMLPNMCSLFIGYFFLSNFFGILCVFFKATHIENLGLSYISLSLLLVRIKIKPPIDLIWIISLPFLQYNDRFSSYGDLGAPTDGTSCVASVWISHPLTASHSTYQRAWRPVPEACKSHAVTKGLIFCRQKMSDGAENA